MKVKINNIVEYACYLCICLIPFFNPYSNSFITYISFIIYGLYIVINLYKDRFIKFNGLLVFGVWSIMITVLMAAWIVSVSPTSINRSIGFILQLVVIVVMLKDKDIYKVIKIYKVLAWLAVIYFFYQIFSYYIIGKAVMFQIPLLDLEDNLIKAYGYLQRAKSYGVTFPRFPGSFSEPAIYAVYVMPLAILYLYENNKEKYKAIFLIVISIFFSTSGVGIIMVIVSLLAWIFWQYGKNKKTILLIPVVAIFLLIIFLLIYFSVPEIRNIVDNLFVASEAGERSKADYRIYRGIYYFFNIPLINKIIGIGLFNAEQFAIQYQIYNIYDTTQEYYEYFNGISQVLIYTGIVGGVAFISFWIKAFLKSANAQRGLVILYILLIIGTSNLITDTGLIYIVLILGLDHMKENKLVQNYNETYDY